MPTNNQRTTANTEKWNQWYLGKTGTEYKPGTAFSKSEGMSDKDFEVGNNLYNAYLQEDSVNKQYDNANAALDSEKTAGQQQAAITLERLKKYLPTIVKSEGLGGLGAAQSVYLQAENDYQNNMAGVADDIGTRKSDLLSSYLDDTAKVADTYSGREQEILNKYTEIENTEKANAQTIAYQQAEARFSELLSQGLRDADGKITEDGKASTQAYLDSMKGQLSESAFSELQNRLDSYQVYTKTEQANANKIAEASTKEAIGGIDESALTDEEKNKLLEQKKTVMKSTRSSGSVTAASTFTINTPGDAGFANNNTTLTVKGSGSAKSGSGSVFSSADEGQVFIKGGIVYVKGKKGNLLQVVNHAGDGPYERLYKYYQGTIYDLG